MVGWHHRFMDTSLSRLWEIVRDGQAWCAVVHGVAESDKMKTAQHTCEWGGKQVGAI